MRTLTVLAACLLVAAALAGCSDGDKKSSSSTSTSGTATSSSSTTSARPNQPPSAVVSAGDVTATDGAAPFVVKFTLDGDDPDGDSLSWALSFGDAGAEAKGTTLPTTVNHNYTAAGNFSVKLTVSDGRNATLAEISVAIVASPAAAPLRFEGAATVPCPQCIAQYNVCVGLLVEVNELQCYFFDVPPEAIGRVATFTNSNGPVSADFVADCAGGSGVDYFADEASPHAVEIPEGTGCIVVYDSTFPTAAFTIDVA